MVDATFTRLPLADDVENGGVINLIEGYNRSTPLLSLIPPKEVALFATGAEAGAQVAPPPGAAHYVLEQVSDTGPTPERFGALMLVAFDVPVNRTSAVDDWYEQEHIGLLMRADGWLRARRYRVLSHTGGPRWTSMAFHELRDASVMNSSERAFARSTAWRAELEKESWFRAAGRGLFRPLA